MKNGFKTSEFWVGLGTTALAYATDATQGTSVGQWVAMANSIAYMALRSWLKK